MYFLAYEAVKDYITDNGKKTSTTLGTILAGGAAGIAYWAIGMPPDVLKSRFQTGKFMIRHINENFSWATSVNYKNYSKLFIKHLSKKYL